MDRDTNLAAAVRAGDTQALETLIGLYRPRAEKYARAILRSPQAAEDAVQEAFARIWAARAGLDPDRPIENYLFTVVRRVCVDEMRRASRSPLPQGELPEIPVPSAEAEFIARSDHLERIHLLASLNEQDRRLLLGSALEGLTSKQLAAETGMTAVQVRVRLHRIRRRLRKGSLTDA